MGLRWADVDLAAGVIRVERAYDAKSRVYRYWIDNAATPNPLLRRLAGHIRQPLVKAFGQKWMRAENMWAHAVFSQAIHKIFGITGDSAFDIVR